MFLYDPVVARGGPIEPFDDGSNKPLQIVQISRRIAVRTSQVADVSGIVTRSVNSVYQKRGYMNPRPTPKIRLANSAM
ncbi:hypothetical protein EMIT0P176_40035 [Pseudomonas sp. IT-P176]